MALFLIVAGCNNRKPGEGRDHEAPATTENLMYINSAGDENLGAVQFGEPVILMAGGKRMQGKKKEDKRKYIDENGEVIYEVKYSDTGFKVKKGEQLIYKVKWNYDDKIKFADNEEMTDVWEIKRSGEKFKSEHNDQTVGEVKISDVAAGNVVLDKYKLSGYGNSLAAGMILLPQEDIIVFMIMMAELKNAGK